MVEDREIARLSKKNLGPFSCALSRVNSSPSVVIIIIGTVRIAGIRGSNSRPVIPGMLISAPFTKPEVAGHQSPAAGGVYVFYFICFPLLVRAGG